MKFKKRSIVVEAWRVKELLYNAKFAEKLLPPSIKRSYDKGDILFSSDHMSVVTLEGKMLAKLDDWIVQGIHGEFYPVKPAIFEQLYEAA